MRRSAMNKRKIDPATTIIPFIIIAILCIYFTLDPENSSHYLSLIRWFITDKFGLLFLMTGLFVFLISLWIAFSDLGRIKLGGADEKPKYSFFRWGAMVFTCGLAADILFYSFCEWIFYAGEPHVQEMGSIQEWASTYPLFHWGLIPWAFYATLAACFGYMLHVKGVHKQKFSEACRPILKEKTDKWPGKLIDIITVIALIAGTATTFSVATPLLSSAITTMLGIPDSKILTIIILIITCLSYTIAVMRGMNGVSWLANACMILFDIMLVFVLVLGKQPVYILETGFSALGNMADHFIGLSTWTDPLRTSSFPQNWTIFYWAYWMVWCVASPFFMGSISRGRTVKQVILGAYIFGTSSTLISFIIFGNYGLGLQMHGIFDAVSSYAQSGDIYSVVIQIIQHLPLWPVFLVLLILTMIAFYATSFDSITMVASQYSYKEFKDNEEASSGMKLFWAILLILLPIALIFSDSSMKNMQTISIIAAFPISIVIILIIASFIKDAKSHLHSSNRRP